MDDDGEAVVAAEDQHTGETAVDGAASRRGTKSKKRPRVSKAGTSGRRRGFVHHDG